MRTAIVSDLHLGSAFGEDVLRDAAIRRAAARGDRRRRPPRPARRRARAARTAAAPRRSTRARPFFEELGEAMARPRGRRSSPATTTTASPSRCSKQLALARRRPLGLEHRARRRRRGGDADRRLARARPSCDIAYPGLWLRDDVYATHGHYMDCHLSLPRVECIAAAAVMRALRPAARARRRPADYERVLRPVYGFSFGLAQSGPGAARDPPLRARLAHDLRPRPRPRPGPPRRCAAPRSAAGFPADVWAHQPPAARRLRRRPLGRGDLPQRRRRRDRAGAPPRRRRRPRDHRPHPPRRPAARAKPSGRCPAAAASTTPAAGSSPPPSTTPARRPAPTGREPSPGSRTRGRRAGSGCSTSSPREELAEVVGRQRARRRALSRPTPSHSAMIAPISGPASSWRKCEAFAIARGGGKLSSLGDPLADRERQHRVGVGPEDQRRAIVLAQRVGDPFALGRAGRVGLGRQDQREGAGAGLRLGASG